MSGRYAGGFIQAGLFNSLSAPPSIYNYNLFAWGTPYNGYPTLGDGASPGTEKSSPVQIGSAFWTSAGSGKYSSLGVQSNNTLWTWGDNTWFGLGFGVGGPYSAPKQLGALTNWLSVSAGKYASVGAIKTNGTLWMWAKGVNGILGFGNANNYSSPTQVGALTNWKILVIGETFSGAIKTDGTLWTWGLNTNGQLGLNDVTYRNSPVQVGALTNWLSLSSGRYNMAAIKTDGTLWTWGSNTYGQLGSNNLTKYSSPKQVGALTNWSTADIMLHTAGVKTDGTLWTWGYNGAGELGLGNTSTYSSPKQIGALTTWANAYVNGYATYAINKSGYLWSWGGGGNNGVLGIGNGITNYSSPMQVGALTTWSKIFSGGYDSTVLGLE